MTFREFTGKNVEEAIRAAMKEFGAELGDLDIEILSQGSRGILGVGSDPARILAAPKAAIEAAETIRAEPPPDVDPDTVPEPMAAPADEADAEADAGEAGAAPTRAGERGGRRGRARGSAAPEGAPEDGEGAAGGVAAAEREESDRLERRRRGGRGRGGRGHGGRNGDARAERAVAERPAREARAERGREPAPFVPGKPLDELSDEERAVLETAKSVLEEMVKLMGLRATVEITTGGETARLNVKGDDLGALIGRRGEKLASLQHIVNLIVGRREGQHHRIAVDVENYRGRREEQLRDVARRAAERVIQTGKIIQLEPMPALERRIVHLALVDNEKVRTQSVGVEPNRRIVVLPASQVKS